nr:unnamed protein product [Callosobruchus chinensis]
MVNSTTRHLTTFAYEVQSSAK